VTCQARNPINVEAKVIPAMQPFGEDISNWPVKSVFVPEAAVGRQRLSGSC